jgi:hypothetical protein
MSTTLIDAPGALSASRGSASPGGSGTLCAPAPLERGAGGSRPTLEELLDERWRTARSHAETECPVCQASMRLNDGLARCGGCGTTLA